MTDLINLMNDLLWGSILVYLLVGVGIYFTVRLGFIQFRHFGHMFSVLKNSRKADKLVSLLSKRFVLVLLHVLVRVTWRVLQLH